MPTHSLKQVIVVNISLNMPPGKMAAQVAHASVAALLKAASRTQMEWLSVGMPKIVLGGSEAAELSRLFSEAKNAAIPACLVHDAGKTVVPEGTVTCLGIGPAPADEIDRLTASLPLL